MRARSGTIAGLALAGALVSFACALPLSAASAKTVIVFSRFDEDFARQRLVAAQPDGSHLRQLTHPAKKDTLDIDAQISPDGTQVVFERDLKRGKTIQIVLIGADGKNERVLDLGCIEPCALDTAPTWTPAAGRIAYTPVIGPFDGPDGAARSAVFQTSALDGSGALRLSEPGIDGVYEDYYARFSPDGSYVVFTRVRNKPFNSAVFRMDSDGTDVRQLTPWKIDADLAGLSPATSGPTQDLVAFETYGHDDTRPEGKTSNVATVPTTCASVSDCRKQIRYLTDLKHPPGARFNPTWSPNGKRIAYVKFRGETKNHECCVGDIFTMDPDGGHRRAVSESPLFEFRPDWGPVP